MAGIDRGDQAEIPADAEEEREDFLGPQPDKEPGEKHRAEAKGDGVVARFESFSSLHSSFMIRENSYEPTTDSPCRSDQKYRSVS
jgi:hypothetical protein